MKPKSPKEKKERIKEIDRIIARIKYLNRTKPLLLAVETKREVNALLADNPECDTSALMDKYDLYMQEYKEEKLYTKPFIQSILSEYHELTGFLYRYDFVQELFVKQGF